MIDILSPFDEKATSEIDAFVDNHPAGTPFHLTAWLRVLINCYGFSPYCIASRDNEGNVRGVLPCMFVGGFLRPKKLVSLPFSDFSGPLATDEMGLADLCDHFEECISENRYNAEIRGPFAGKLGFVSKTYFRHHFISLPQNSAFLLPTLNKRTVQYSIRKSEKMGVVVRKACDREGMEEFIRLNRLTRRKHGVPPQPDALFLGILEHMIEKGRGCLILGYYKDKAASGALLIKTRNTVVYKYNASDPELLSSLSPNHIVTWHAIDFSCREGARIFDFGRTDLNQEGLLRYKEMWATSYEDVPYSYYPAAMGALHAYQESVLGSFAKSIWRLLPPAISSRIGSMIYKYTA